MSDYAFEAPLEQGGEAVMGIRPEHLFVDAGDLPLRLPFTVKVSESMGADSVLWGTTAGQKASVRFGSDLKLNPPRGSEMELGFSPRALSLFDAESGVRL